MQSAIEQFAEKPGAEVAAVETTRRRRKRGRKRGGGDEAFVRSSNLHLTDACQPPCFDMSSWGPLEVK